MLKRVLSFVSLAMAMLLLVPGGLAQPLPAAGQAGAVEELIRVDQFGYLTMSPKVAVIADPVVGFNDQDSFVAGELYQVRRWSDDQAVFSGVPTQWADEGGLVDEQSGDAGWWFDFTDLRTPGSYYLYDLDNEVRSHRFEIGDDVYDDVLDAAMKVFWFNRGNVAHTGAVAGPWVDSAAYVGPRQDTEARWIDQPDNQATERDLSGGWFDAGDTNKYVTFASSAVHQLLTSYERYPELFDDNAGIPESGNGVPDLLDEVMVEIDWLKKMQNSDGGVLLKVGETEYTAESPPSEVRFERFYEEACSSSTIAAASMFAHASLVLRGVPGFAKESARLHRRALKAWRWYQRNPVQEGCDLGLVNAGDADMTAEEQAGQELVAAVYLHELKPQRKFRRAIARNLSSSSVVRDPDFARYGAEEGDALLKHIEHPKAGKKTTRLVRREVRRSVANDVVRFAPEAGLYRSYLPTENIHWGSNFVRANAGSSSASIAEYGYDADRRGLHLDRASTNLQQFHGLNPLGVTYLSNTEGLGAEHSVSEIYHYWFADGTEFDSSVTETGPPPGYVVGGANATYSGSLSPPAGQPPLKSYFDWNAFGNVERAYEISEPGVSYQAAYIRLLASVMANDRG